VSAHTSPGATALASASLRLSLVEDLASSGVLRDPHVRDAFLHVPRELFVPAFARRHGLDSVYANRVIVTKRSPRRVPLSSLSEPQVMAAMLERLELAEGMRVLEIGTGSGYNTALLKTLVGRAGRVVSLDIDRELSRAARRALRAGGYAARLVCCDGREGYERAAPYDRIVATASAARIPRMWRDQLADGGLLQVPIRVSAEGTQAIATFRRAGTRLESVEVIPGRFMPMRAAGSDGVAVPMLTVNSTLGSGRSVMTRLAGAAVGELSQTARQRLRTALASRPRCRTLAHRAAPWPLGLYLSLEIPRRLVIRYADAGIGVVGRGGRSVALLEGDWKEGHKPRALRMLSYGESDAEDYLKAVLEAWERRGRPDSDRLELAVEFTSKGSRISHRWTPGAGWGPGRAVAFADWSEYNSAASEGQNFRGVGTWA
jgi:protein-L-isoaspartate(D-aspartate) O-methyltransferase